MKTKHEKVAFVSLTYAAVFTFLLNSLLSFFFGFPNWSLLLHSLCYTSKFPFQTSEQTNLFPNGCVSPVDLYDGVTCLSLPVLSNIFPSHQVTFRDVKYLVWKKLDVSPLSTRLFFLPDLVHITESEISGCSSQNLFIMMVNPLCHFAVAVCCLVLTFTESVGAGFDREVILCQKAWTSICVWPCNL